MPPTQTKDAAAQISFPQIPGISAGTGTPHLPDQNFAVAVSRTVRG